MLLKQTTLRGIQDGRISLVFRRWKRPTVKTGGTLHTAVGQLAIREVTSTVSEDISERDAVAAGYGSRDELVRALEQFTEGTLYRIRIDFLGTDPRIELRNTIPDEGELKKLFKALGRSDQRSTDGPWTLRILQVIDGHPAIRAGDLAPLVSMDKPTFKTRVRRLKSLGLTESLKVGYRLSPRGSHVLAAATGDQSFTDSTPT